MNRLAVVAYLPVEEVRRRYRSCPDPKEQTRWNLLWLLLRPAILPICEEAAPFVGLSDVCPHPVLKRWNALRATTPEAGLAR
jgi:hypothetical protein